MNRSILLSFVLALGLVIGVRVYSQNVTGAKNAVQQLEAMKAANAALIEKQTAMLQKLDELYKEAAQTKFMVKRG
jgi:hypothetical protein